MTTHTKTKPKVSVITATAIAVILLGGAALAGLVLPKATNNSPTLAVTYPNGGETFASGITSQIGITWTSTNIQAVDIYLACKESGAKKLAEKVRNAGSFQWLVPSDVLVTNTCKIKIQGGGPIGSVEDDSDDFFTVKPAIITTTTITTTTTLRPTITTTTTIRSTTTTLPGNSWIKITDPASGANLKVGQRYAIRWNAYKVYSNVQVSYSPDSVSWTTLASGLPSSSGVYEWTVDVNPQNNARISVGGGTVSTQQLVNIVPR
jgi:hypothetical protein